MKKLSLIAISLIALNASNLDSDLDGVIDTQDKCPNTPFLEIVDKNGCSKAQLKKLNKNNIKFNVSIGYEHDNYDSSSNDLVLANIMAYTKSYSIIYAYSMLEGKSNDSILSLYYKKFITPKTKLKVGIKTYFPTYYNDKIDYALKIKATYYANWAYSISEKHKIYTESGTNDKDTITIEAAKTFNKFYISPYAYTENSAYDSSDWNYYAGLFTQYSLTKQLSVSLDLSTDIQNSTNYTLVTTLGYSF